MSSLASPSADAYHLQKAGNTQDEYEDAFAIGQRYLYPDKQRQSLDGWRQSFAVTDGATESSYAHLWARLLAEGYAEHPYSKAGTQSRLVTLQQRWQAEAGAKDLPWYAEEHVREGAYAAFVGLTIHARRKRTWNALAVGDSCLFHVRNDQLNLSFPLRRSDDFSNRPLLLSSRPDRNIALWTHPTAVATAHGFWQPGDLFLLMSDALACWFLRRFEREDTPWSTLHDVTAVASNQSIGDAHQSRFASFINEMREQPDMLRNDDVTLLMIQLPTEDVS